MTRDYYNRRSGAGGERPRLTLPEMAGNIAGAYRFILERGYLQRSFGYYCVDGGEVPGRDGNGINEALLLATGVRAPTLLEDLIRDADEAVVFTIVEFVFDHLAKPLENTGRYHPFNNCGWHYDSADPRFFDEPAARGEWRAKINGALKFYEDGFELSEAGEVVRLAPDGVTELVRAPLPATLQRTDAEKVAHAIRTFHLGRATREERKQAVRSLFDILEFHRATVKALLSKDEGELFNIANNFSIRHHRATEKDEYDEAWLTWMFYVNLSTVHLVLRRVHGASSTDHEARPGKVVL